MAITNAENRDTESEDSGVKVRRGRIIDAVRPAGKDNALAAFPLYLFCVNAAVGFHFGIDMLLPDPSGDQEVILTAEVQNKNLFLHASHSTVSDFARFFRLVDITALLSAPSGAAAQSVLRPLRASAYRFRC